jgi:hypothetical protein
MLSGQYKTEKKFLEIEDNEDDLIREMKMIAGDQAALTIVARSDFAAKAPLTEFVRSHDLHRPFTQKHEKC